MSDTLFIFTARLPHHVLTIAALLTGLHVAHAEPGERGPGERPLGERLVTRGADPGPSARGNALTDTVPAQPPTLWPRGMLKLESGMSGDLEDVLAVGLGATALTSGVLMLLRAKPLEKVRMFRPGGGLGVALRLRF